MTRFTVCVGAPLTSVMHDTLLAGGCHVVFERAPASAAHGEGLHCYCVELPADDAADAVARVARATNQPAERLGVYPGIALTSID